MPNSRFATPPALLAAACLLAGALTTRADWTLLTPDSPPQSHLTINTWNPADGLSATNQAGNLVHFASRDILALSSAPSPAAAPPAPWRLVLRNGDVLLGQPVNISGQSLLFNVHELGTIAIPLKVLASMSNGSEAMPPVLISAGISGEGNAAAGAEKDVVRTKSTKPAESPGSSPPAAPGGENAGGGGGDTVDGIILSIDDSKVLMASGNAADLSVPDITLKLANIERITFGGVAPPRTVPPLSARLTFISGSTLTVPLDSQNNSFNWTLNDLTIKDPAGQDRTVSTMQLAGVDILGGRVVYLTELDPAREEQNSFLDSHLPAMANRNALGQPLHAGQETFTRGIGVHTQSTLAYDLDGSFDTLALRVALDDSAAPYGQAHVYITLDGKTLWDLPALKPGDPTPQLNLPIRGGKHLELHADPAARLDVLGRVDWLNAALRRP